MMRMARRLKGRRLATSVAALVALSALVLASCTASPRSVRVLGSSPTGTTVPGIGIVKSGVAATTSTAAATTTTSASTTTTITPPPPCPPATHPPGAPYQLRVQGTLKGEAFVQGLQSQIVPPYATINPISATLCGLLQLPSQQGTVPPANLIFAQSTVRWGTPPNNSLFQQDTLATAPAVSTVVSQPAANGGLDLTLTSFIKAIGHISPPSVVCVFGSDANPIVVTASTQGSVVNPATGRTVDGVALTGPLTDATATIVGTGFTIPQIVDNGSTCTGLEVSIFNGTFNLPNNHTILIATLKVSISPT